MKNKTLIYADGSSLGNPGPGGWGAVLVFSENQNGTQGRVLEIGGGDAHTTNNRMELTAVIEALTFTNKLTNFKTSELTIRTDSRYVINGVTKWVAGWEKSGWKGKNKKDILNQDLWRELMEKVKGRAVTFEHVHGHVGVPGNERADFIATLCAREKQFKRQRFFDGPLDKYPYDVYKMAESKKKSGDKKRNAGKAYSYLSLVGGKALRHATWAECEKRVKGVSGARFKKALSPEDEQNILNEWKIQNNR